MSVNSLVEKGKRKKNVLSNFVETDTFLSTQKTLAYLVILEDFTLFYIS